MVLKQVLVLTVGLLACCNPSTPAKTQNSSGSAAAPPADKRIVERYWFTGGGSDSTLLLTTLEGKDVRLANYAAKVTVIAVWASFCEPCKDELPFVDALYKKYQGDKDVAIISVSLDDDAHTASSAAKEWGLTFPVLLDIGKQLQNRFTFKPGQAYLPLPTFIVIDSKFRFVREIGFQSGLSQAEFVDAKSQQIELAKSNQLPDEKPPTLPENANGATMTIPAGSQKAWPSIQAKLKTYGFANAMITQIGKDVQGNKEVRLKLPKDSSRDDLNATIERNSNGTRQSFPPPAPDLPGKMHVFKYDDFGPQSLAGTLLGEDCYGECCCSEPGDSFEVRIVVYQGVTEREVKQQFTSGANLGEYRYVPVGKAKKFIADSVKDIAGNAANSGLAPLLTTLRRTERQLAENFPL